MINSLILAIRFILLYLVITLVIPGVNGTEHVWTLIQYVVVNPAEYMFHFFHDISNAIGNSDMSEQNPLQDFGSILMMIGCVGLSLAVPLLYILFWIVILFLSVPFDLDDSPEAKNMQHLLNGRTTIQDTFDAEVQANEIASALKK